MTEKVYVANLLPEVEIKDLEELFEPYGPVLSVDVVKDPATGLARGFAFVELRSDEKASEAIEALSGHEFMGKTLKVNEHRKKSRNRGGDEEGMGDGEFDKQPMGYFRAQPLDLGLKRKRRQDPFTKDDELKIDYKNPKILTRFMSERGRILPRRMTGLSAFHQRKVSEAIKRAQQVALIPYVR